MLLICNQAKTLSSMSNETWGPEPPGGLGVREVPTTITDFAVTLVIKKKIYFYIIRISKKAEETHEKLEYVCILKAQLVHYLWNK